MQPHILITVLIDLSTFFPLCLGNNTEFLQKNLYNTYLYTTKDATCANTYCNLNSLEVPLNVTHPELFELDSP